MKHIFLKTSAILLLSLSIGACQTTSSVEDSEFTSVSNRTSGTMMDSKNTTKTSTKKSKKLSKVKTGSLENLEKDYMKSPDSEAAAISFARALRKNDFVLRAATVLEPFAKNPDASSLMYTEYSAVKLEQGAFAVAEKYARKAIATDESNYEAYQFLGVALDAQEDHENAETAFRTALEMWEGDPTIIMNNLALNLASQEHLDEAEEILLKAKAIAPNRREVERNLRIVRALKESSSYTWKDKVMLKPSSKPNN